MKLNFKENSVWVRSSSAVFFRTKEEHGGLSNFARGFPSTVGSVHGLTSEALYQSMRFERTSPEIAAAILAAESPMSAKRRRRLTRPDWDSGFKFQQHPEKFGALLAATRGRDIVEQSRRDTYRGAPSAGSSKLYVKSSACRTELKSHSNTTTKSVTAF